MTARDSRVDLAIAAILAVSAAAVYGLGAAPSVYVGDSGELAAAVATLGIPHPSGYPLYVMLGKLWVSAVPFGTVAYELSLFSAVAAGACIGTVYLLSRRVGASRSSAVLAALLLATSASFWSQANIQRVYALNALFLVVALLMAARWLETRHRRMLTAAFFVCGLGASNHTFMGLVALALVTLVVAAEPDLLISPRRLSTKLAPAAAALLLGLCPYLYLPIRSRADPALDWGNPETLRAFWNVVTRHEFWERAWVEKATDVVPILADWLASIPTEFTWAGAFLALAGLVGAGLRTPLRMAFVTLLALNVASMALHGSRSDLFIWHRYYLPTYVIAAILAGAGWDGLARRMPRRTTWLMLALPLLLAARNWRDFDRSQYRVAEDFAEAVFESLPPGAHLLASDDNILFALIYLHLAEGYRPDVNLVLQGVGKAHLPRLTFDPENDPLYFTHHPNWDHPDIDAVPVGLVFRAWRRDAVPPAPVSPRRELAGEKDPRVPKDYRTRNLIGHFHYMLGVTALGSDWPRARAELALAAEIAADNDVLLYNLGLIYQHHGLYDEAVAAFARASVINPRHLAGPGRPRPLERLREARGERDRIAQVEQELQTALAGDRVRVGTAAYHSALAELLEARGETSAARGQRLRARASNAGVPRPIR